MVSFKKVQWKMGNDVPGSMPPPRKPRETRKKREQPQQAMIGKRRKKREYGPDIATRLPQVTPHAKCKLRLLKVDRIKDHLLLEEEFIRNRERLKPNEAEEEIAAERKEIEMMRGSCMRVATLAEMMDDDHAIVTTIIGDTYMPVMSFVDRDMLEPGCTVLTTFMITALVGVLPRNKVLELSKIKLEKAPKETYADVGGLQQQIQELKESVELPLTRPDLYEEMGILPPKGVLLYGPPGTGKTLMAKAVANKTSATFIRIVGSDLVKKFAGEGPKLVRDIFQIAEDHAPSIIFIDEIDAVGTKRRDGAREGEKEVQRTMLELLTQMDGFDKKTDIKIIMATNRIESLDPALIRPGRIDRKIEVPLPEAGVLEDIFRIQTKLMNLSFDVRPEDFIASNEGLSGADIKALCTEAGLMALRERRTQINKADFMKSKENVIYRKQDGSPLGMYL